MFARRGFAGSRLSDVAESLGVSRQALLYHFPSKSALHDAVREEVSRRMAVAATQALSAGGSIEDRATTMLRAYVTFLETEPDVARFQVRELLEGRQPAPQVVQLLGVVRTMLQSWAGPSAIGDMPRTTGVLALAASAMIRAASSPEWKELWGPEEHLVDLGRTLLGRVTTRPDRIPD